MQQNSAMEGVAARWPERIWVVRHGQSAGNVARDHAEANNITLIELEHRDADVPLSSLGERQSQALGAWVLGLAEHQRPQIVLTSPYMRARQTAQAVADALGPGHRLIIDERLREKEFGVLDRYTSSGIVATFPELAAQRRLVGKFYFRPPGGESWCDVILRLRGVVGDLQRNHAGARVMIVAHQVIVNCMRYLLEGMDEDAILDLDREGDVPNCGVTEYYAAEGGQLALVHANFISPELAEAPTTASSDQPAGAK
ncbi:MULTISPECIES: histidine phosphatase family protein [Stenotrophomonas]|jgi:broad specificity phosphatase PhoE|nr:histidine phosphatase family protein [Stenotrophomonas maltophilia]MCV4213929.1 histidine phosphatase family protein [Pseudomonas cichorii]HEJ4266859.1 histidine phosphatase family protein [Pseudomonas aeruginosa]MBA0298123.1 histidine phosphatase family protein [Stenotrophomonas maltophilia]MBA0353140.1 histidine phosphatase family protein [Stenotrophomonas maltophilia]PSD18537.1 histidine phosphatase family protein [Stenotrophomonas maltophilia]